MIRYLSLKNFRAFKYQKFELSNINVFVGANNTGKSSALSALNLIAQTLDDNRSDAPLVLRGKFDDLGTFIDLVHGHKPGTPIDIEIQIDEYIHRYEFKYRSQRKEIELVKYELFWKAGEIYSYKSKKDSYEIKYNRVPFDACLPGVLKRRPAFLSGLLVRDRNLYDVAYRRHRDEGAGHQISDLTRTNLTSVDRHIRQAQWLLNDTFYSFDSLSPFRSPPQRAFLFSGGSPSRIGRNGENAIDMLVSDTLKRGSVKRGLIESVSRWFQSTGMAKCIDVKSLTSRHFEICVIGNDDSENNICDVGFGCSQVLPVLIGALNLFGASGSQRAARKTEGPVYVVQEPEIHLHPNAQAELGTFFVEMVKAGGQLFIETHSDNLLIRLQQHVARGDISPTALKVFYILDRNGTKEVIDLNVNRQGFFNREWPGGFFPQRQLESLELARAAASAPEDDKEDLFSRTT